jgi:hypothetical protein
MKSVESILSCPASAKREVKGIHTVKKELKFQEIDSLPLAAYCRSAGNDKMFLTALRS